MHPFIKLSLLFIALALIFLMFPSAHICIAGLSAYVAIGFPILIAAWIAAFVVLRYLSVLKLTLLMIIFMLLSCVVWITIMSWREFHILCW